MDFEIVYHHFFGFFCRILEILERRGEIHSVNSYDSFFVASKQTRTDSIESLVCACEGRGERQDRIGSASYDHGETVQVLQFHQRTARRASILSLSLTLSLSHDDEKEYDLI